jgi:hypothetical protein
MFLFRYFVIKVVEEGKAAHLGLGFADRKQLLQLFKKTLQNNKSYKKQLPVYHKNNLK